MLTLYLQSGSIEIGTGIQLASSFPLFSLLRTCLWDGDIHIQGDSSSFISTSLENL